MNPTAEIRLECVDPHGTPAAMVATWVMDELLAFYDVQIRSIEPDEVTLKVAPEDFKSVRASVAALLDEPRFMGWIICGIPGSHTDSLPDSRPS